MRVLLVSTYELGHQPLHLAAPAAELEAAGHEVAFLDLAVDAWDETILADVDAVAVSVPMHTALRLGVEAGRRIKAAFPGMPLAFYGLYAGVATEESPADRFLAGEYEDGLVSWVAGLKDGKGPERAVSVEIGRRRFKPPSRAGLPDLGRYAHLSTATGHVAAGYVEASRGCRHRCKHCPIPAVYDGRYRITGKETVLADIASQVSAGAGHVTFGDPDFLNGPAYALDLLESAHASYPDVTFDVTVKVEHLLAHSDLLPRLTEAGVLFIVSAFESMDDRILDLLAKGHTAADAHRAVELTRRAGMEIHPTWLPFTPWTELSTVVDIARFVWRLDLAPATDPVQLSIRLLIPDGSLILDIPGVDSYISGYDPDALGHMWASPDPQVDSLQRDLTRIASEGADATVDPIDSLEEMTLRIEAVSGVTIPRDVDRARSVQPPPRLSEPWFCCSEPTVRQLEVLG